MIQERFILKVIPAGLDFVLLHFKTGNIDIDKARTTDLKELLEMAYTDKDILIQDLLECAYKKAECMHQAIREFEEQDSEVLAYKCIIDTDKNICKFERIEKPTSRI